MKIGFLRHLAESVIKRSCQFDIVQTGISRNQVKAIPSKVAPQQSLCPLRFNNTNIRILIFHYSILICQPLNGLILNFCQPKYGRYKIYLFSVRYCPEAGRDISNSYLRHSIRRYKQSLFLKILH